MKGKALIIDDEEDIGELFSYMLRSMGYTADHTGTLNSGIAAFETARPDIVFLDLMLPDGEGFSIVPKLKEKKENTTIVIISANDSTEEKERAREMGVDHYIVKPFGKQQIEKALRA